jgi:transcriptional regulator with XRE-family HTH domain/lambda repressor-like predicted transcriptional regulator
MALAGQVVLLRAPTAVVPDVAGLDPGRPRHPGRRPRRTLTPEAGPARPRTQARVTYEKRRNLLIAQGRWNPDEPAGPVRAHVDSVLDETGMSIAQFAACAGLSRLTVSAVLGSTDRVKTATAAKIRAVTPGSVPATGWVDATGATRRLQALAYAGWALKPVAVDAGVDEGWLRAIRAGRTSGRVQAAVARKIAGAFSRLLPLAPPRDTRYQRVAVTRAVNLAAAEGWVSGWAWDDIDDPAEKPKGAIRRTPAGT